MYYLRQLESIIMNRKEVLRKVIQYYHKRFDSGKMSDKDFDVCVYALHCMSYEQLLKIYNEEVKK